MKLFGILNQTNTDFIRELIKNVLYNHIRDVTSHPNYTCFGDDLDRKGPSSSKQKLSVQHSQVYSFSTFVCWYISGSSSAKIFQSDFRSCMPRFRESSEVLAQCQKLLWQAAGAGELDNRLRVQVSSPPRAADV